jgi:hypothetical protein
MEQLAWMLTGAGALAGLILVRLAARHGFAWVRVELKARADAAEAGFKTRVSAAAGDLAPRISAIEGRVPAFMERLARVEAEIAAVRGTNTASVRGG